MADPGRANGLARCQAVAQARSRCSRAFIRAPEHVVRRHYSRSTKTAVTPRIRGGPELRTELDSVLLPGKTLTGFIDATVGRAIGFRRVQPDFAVRCDASLATHERTGISIPSGLVLAKLKTNVAVRMKPLRK